LDRSLSSAFSNFRFLSAGKPQPIREEYLIVDDGKLAGAGAHSYSAGNTTQGADEAARFRTTG
jgi:hypothetical protein